MGTEPKVGELRAWNANRGGEALFFVVGIDGFRVDVIRPNGSLEGVFRTYLVSNSHVVSDEKLTRT